MYNLLFDSDALIKLTHSGALTKVCETFNCIITNEIKRETVEEGKIRLYPDAEIIDELIKKSLIKIKNPKNIIKSIDYLGKGELSILSLSKEDNYIIISDDQTFIKELEKENLDFMVPMDIIITLIKLGKINKKETKEYLEKIKVFIREQDYKRLKKEIGG